MAWNCGCWTTASYGGSTPTQGGGSGASTEPVSAALTGLKPNTTYHYRLVASSPAGTTSGADQTFTTPKPRFAGAYAPSQIDHVSRKGRVSIAVQCPKATYGRCIGTMQLKLLSSLGRGRVQASFSIASARQTLITVQLSPGAQELIRRAGLVVGIATVTSHDGWGTRHQSSRWIRLSAPAPRR